MIGRIRRLTGTQRVLLAAFVAAGIATAVFGTRAVVSAIYWSQHRDEPLAGWMSIGYVARSHEVPPQVLLEALGLDPGVRDRRPLSEIAAAAGRPLAEVTALLAEAIAEEKAERAKRDGPREPPP